MIRRPPRSTLFPYTTLFRSVIPEVNLRPIPEGLSFEEAAAFPLVFLTAWRMLVSKARVLPGEAVLILGIGGGVARSEEHTSELPSQSNLVCRLLLGKKNHTNELQSQSNLVWRRLLEKKANTGSGFA